MIQREFTTPEQENSLIQTLRFHTSLQPPAFTEKTFKSVSRQDRKTCMELLITPKQAAHLRHSLNRLSNHFDNNLLEFNSQPVGKVLDLYNKFLLSHPDSFRHSDEAENFKQFFGTPFNFQFNPCSFSFLRVIYDACSIYFKLFVRFQTCNLAAVSLISGFHESMPMNIITELNTAERRFYYQRSIINSALQAHQPYTRRLTENEKTSFLYD